MIDEIGFAVDTNLFVYPTARRLLNGIARETGRVVYLLPGVRSEILDRGNLCAAEMGRWRRRRNSADAISGDTIQRIESAVAAAGEQWFEEEVARRDSVFRLVDISDEQDKRDVNRIAEAIPATVFSIPGGRSEVSPDRLVVAQAIFSGIDLLSTNNLKSIDHEALNAWLRSKGGWNRDLIYTPSQTVLELCGNDVRLAHQFVIAHATNRVSQFEDENRDEVRRALDVLDTAGFGRDGPGQQSDAFRTIVYRLKAELRLDREFDARFRAAVASRHRQPPIDTELRLNERINRAVDRVVDRR